MYPICDITPFTLQDFPNHTACILWFYSCNFRCLYCYNVDLVERKMPPKKPSEIWDFLNSRKGLLNGVVLSGGECTLYPNLQDLIKDIRSLGFKVKIDTNGTNPEMLKLLCQNSFVDYISLDYKAPDYLFSKIVKYKNPEPFFETLDYLCGGNVEFEVRTTVHTELLSEVDVTNIILDLDKRNFRGTYYIQNFNDTKTLSKLPKQTRVLDISLLPTPQNFIIKTRNWPT